METASRVRTPAPVRESREARLDVAKVRRDFPILARKVHGKPLVYLDNGATTQKPQAVIDAITAYYSSYNSNIHRGVHALSQEATDAYEAAREKARSFLGAERTEEIVFVRGATEAINLVAESYVRPRIEPGDEIIITAMEHHSNIVPWQMLRDSVGAVLRIVPFDQDGGLELEEYERAFGPRTRFVSTVHISNALGTTNPVRRMVEIAHRHGVPVLLDGAQAAGHRSLDVRDLDCDFYAISGHKMYGPTGIGVLYGKRRWLEEMPPYQGGGDMIASVTFEKTTYNKLPHKFEAGTPHIAGVIGLGAAIDYLRGLGLDAIARHERELLEYATAAVRSVPGLEIIGNAAEKAGILSFSFEDIHPHDIGTVLDQEGIAVRAGHHCAQPVMERFGVPATVRASFGLYNTREEVDALVRGLQKVREIFC